MSRSELHIRDVSVKERKKNREGQTLEGQLSLSHICLRRLLVGVRAIPQSRPLHRSGEPLRGQLRARVLLPEVSADRLIVLRGHLERLQRKLAAKRLPDVGLPLAPRLEKFRIVGGVREHRDALMVLRSGTEERHASDVNLFYGIGERAVRLGDGGGERVEIADDDGDGRDRLRLEICFVGRDGASKNA